MEIQASKWEDINVDFIVCFPQIRRKNDSTCVSLIGWWNQLTIYPLSLPIRWWSMQGFIAIRLLLFIVSLYPLLWMEVLNFKYLFKRSFQKSLGKQMIYKTFENVHIIRNLFKTTYSRQKSYAANKRRELEFEAGNKVYLKNSPIKMVLWFGKKT